MRRAAAGFAGGLLGALAMDAFARLVRSVNHGREADGAAPGLDRAGRGVQPPQAAGSTDQDATILAGTAVYRSITGDEPDRRTRHWLGSAIHYAFGGAVGLCYALVRDAAPLIRAAHGTAYGTLVWAVADEGVMPALALSRGPRHLPTGVHAFALIGHWVYGVTLEEVVRRTDV